MHLPLLTSDFLPHCKRHPPDRLPSGEASPVSMYNCMRLVSPRSSSSKQKAWWWLVRKSFMFMYTGVHMVRSLNEMSRSIRPSRVKGCWTYARGILSAFLKFFFLRRATVATFLNRLSPMMVISAPVLIILNAGTPCTYTLAHWVWLPLSLTRTRLTSVFSSEEGYRRSSGSHCLDPTLPDTPSADLTFLA